MGTWYTSNMAFIELLLMQKNFMFLSIQERSGLHNMPEVCMKKKTMC